MTSFELFLTALSRSTALDGVLGDERAEYPPSEGSEYWATPKNAVVFGWMGVDGVHYAILKIDGEVREDSPVIQIGPMDFSEPYSLLAPTFVDCLATGCGVNLDEIEDVLASESAGPEALLGFLRSHFDSARFWSGGAVRDIAPFVDLIVLREDADWSCQGLSSLFRRTRLA